MVFLGPIAKPELGFDFSGTNPPELTCKLLILCLRLQERQLVCQINGADVFQTGTYMTPKAYHGLLVATPLTLHTLT